MDFSAHDVSFNGDSTEVQSKFVHDCGVLGKLDYPVMAYFFQGIICLNPVYVLK